MIIAVSSTVSGILGSIFFFSFVSFAVIEVTHLRLRIQSWIERTMQNERTVKTDLTELYSPQVRDRESRARESAKAKRVERQ